MPVLAGTTVPHLGPLLLLGGLTPKPEFLECDSYHADLTQEE